MVIMALIVLGITAYNKMPNELTPKIEFPFIAIVTVYPGAGPQEMETLVSEPIEDAVGSTGGLRNITSTSRDGVSMVGLEFELGTDLNAAAADVRDKLTAAKARLPRDIEEPTIYKADITSQPIMTIAIEGDMPSKDKRILADTLIKDSFSKIAGVASVSVSGGDIREVSVSVDKNRLDAYGITIDQLAAALRAENLNLPSGSVKEGPDGLSTRSYTVRTVGEFKSADEISNTRINIPGPNGGTVRLGDIAVIQDTIEERDTITRLNGKDSVVLAVQKQSDANTLTVARGIKEEIDRFNGYTTNKGKVIKGTLPKGAKLLITTDESEFVEESLADVRKSLTEGIILVVLIVFLFLHSVRATFIVATAIPTCIVATFLPIWAFGFTLNMMTLLALALVVGILVDDSIVVLENIERHLRKGEDPPDAALNGRSEIGLAAITITLVDVVVFIPIAFMGGIVGQFFRQFGITVATATLFSLFVSFTLTPMLASRMMKAYARKNSNTGPNGAHPTTEDEPVGFFGRLFAHFDAFYGSLDANYRKLLTWTLANRGLTLVIGLSTLFVVLGMLELGPKFNAYRIVVGILAVTLSLIFARRESRRIAVGYSLIIILMLAFIRFPIGGEMMPTTDQGKFTVSVELPAGSGLDATDQVVREIEALLEDMPGIEYYMSSVGNSSSGIFGAGDSGPQYGQVTVTMVDRSEKIKVNGQWTRRKPVEDIITELSEKTALIPGGEIRVAIESNIGGGQPLSMEITGPNMQDLISVANQVEAKMKEVPGAIDVQNSWEVDKPELQVSIDRIRASDMGLSISQIASTLRTSIEGNSDAKLRDAGEEYDIRVRLTKLNRQSTADVSNIIVGHTNGTPIYLRDVAKVELAAAPNKIDRKNRQRLITVSAGLAQGYSLANVQNEVNKSLQQIQTGSTRIGTGGMGEIMLESAVYMFSALILAIILVYMLMAALFESLITPWIIMLSLPQAMVGALLALMLTGYTLSIVTMIGIIMLVGLVAKNAILLVDYTNTLRGRGYERDEAILEAGPTRLRPILMTTLAMIGGMLPTALVLSSGAEWRAPMAVAVIGGLILSTMLTLLVIPTFYSALDDLIRFIRRLIGLDNKPQIKPSADTDADAPLIEVTPEQK